MIYWAPLLHFYQPPTQLIDVLDRICDECYRPLIRVFEHLGSARATVNVNGSLVELLKERHADDVVDGLRRLGENGQVEFTGSAMYHPILPLIPASEARRQIVLNRRTNREAFGKAYDPSGFFPPELCIGQHVAATVVETGHRWLLASGVACSDEWPVDFVPTVKLDEGDLTTFFRDDLLSNRIAFADLDAEGFLANARALKGDREDIYVVTAMDAETFGHHVPGWEEQFLARAYQLIGEAHSDGGNGATTVQTPIQAVTISQLIDLFPGRSSPMPRASSWSTNGDDLAADNPYPLWKDPGNRVHDLQWQLTNLVLDLTQRAEAQGDTDSSRRFARIARVQADRALHSCQYWWASRRPMWDVNMIHRGLIAQQEALVNATRAVRCSHATEEARAEATYRFIAAREVMARILDELIA